MKSNGPMSLVVVLLMAGLSQHLHGQDVSPMGKTEQPKPFSLKEDTLGMPLSEYKAKYNRPLPKDIASARAPIVLEKGGGWTYATTDTPYEWRQGLKPKPTVAGIEVEPIDQFFSSGPTEEPKLAQSEIRIQTSSFDPLLLALNAKYRDPSKASEEVLQNRMGASFSARKVTWDNRVGQIIFIERYERIDQGLLEYRHLALLAKAAEQSREKLREKASDL